MNAQSVLNCINIMPMETKFFEKNGRVEGEDGKVQVDMKYVLSPTD